ncbi:MAG: CCA tRNA nucleotidyltransferase [Pseudomonadota bacterium]
MKLTGAWIEDPAVQDVCRMLEEGGHRALLVGGCVRNALMGEPVSDIDISTDARPDRVLALAEQGERKAVGTGLEHGTVTVVEGRRGFEITTFRKDVETDGRHAVVAFADDIESDARRRDFTVNAIYSIRDGTVLDPLGGLSDLAERRIRFIGDASQRIREDYLRILRFFRFHAWYGKADAGLDAEGLAACAELADGLGTLSRERVGAEILKLLAAPDPAPVVASMRQAGILQHVLRGAEPTFLGPLVHCEKSLGLDPDPLRRLAVLGGEMPDQSLRLNRKDARRLAVLRESTEAEPAVLGYHHGAQAALDLLCLRSAAAGTEPDVSWRSEIARGAEAQFPVAAEDLMPAYQGPALGQHLRALEETWIASGFTLSRAQLLDEDKA